MKGPLRKSRSSRLNDLIAAKEKELTKITRYRQSLYGEWKDEEITRGDYHHMCADYKRQATAIQAVPDNLTVERDEPKNGVTMENPFLAVFRKHENIDRLTREMPV